MLWGLFYNITYNHSKILRKPTQKVGFLFLVLFLLGILPGLVFASEPQDIKESYVTSDRFTISWITGVQETAKINYGSTPSLGNTAYDTRGQLYQGTTHYITVTGLLPNSTYYYDIISGGVTYDNGGSHYTITTGADLSPAADSDIAYGQVFLSDGATPAQDAIVYIKLRDNDSLGTSGDSQLCSSLVDNTGYWHFELKNIRIQTLNSYFDYSDTGDSLVLEAKGPNGEIALQSVDTGNDSPAPPMTLRLNNSPVLDWTAESGYESDGLNPEIGYASTNFTFKIKYTDSDGDPPSVHELRIDKNGDGDYSDSGEVVDMTATGSDYASGVIYSYTTTIPYSSSSNNRSYYFRFSDGSEFATGDITQAISKTTAINKPDVYQTLGISIDKNTWNITPVPIQIPASGQAMSGAERIKVTNSGDGLQTYTLMIQDEDNKDEWLHSPNENGAALNTYVLGAVFCGVSDTPNLSHYNEGDNDDIIIDSLQIASSTRFACSSGSQNGQSVPSLDDVYLYFRLDLPTAVRGTYFDEEHGITIELSCQGE